MNHVVDQGELKALVDRFGISQEFKEFFRGWNIEKRYKYLNMQSSTIDEICQKINYKKRDAPNRSSAKKYALWFKGQFKLFIWVSGFYIFNLQLSIRQLKRKDYQVLASIFLGKTIEKMKYELRSLLGTERSPRKKWDQEQVSLLKTIIQKYEARRRKPQWKSIAFEMFSKSRGEYFRTFGQCRQMWANHLNNTVSKHRWTEDQDKLLLKLVVERNKKWSKIAQVFEGKRSGHMIKNRYLTLMKKKDYQVEPTQTNVPQISHPSIFQKIQENVELSSKLSTIIQINSQQNSNQKKLDLEPDFSVSFSIQAQQDSKQSYAGNQLESQKNMRFNLLQGLKQGWYLSKQNQHEMNLIDYSSIQMVKFFNDSNLLQVLGCSHYEQLQLAFQKEARFTIETED